MGRGQGTSGKLCTHCGKTNHTVDTCYYKHGFPPGYKPKGARSAYAANTDIENIENSSEQVVRNPTGVTFTQEQYQGIQALLQQSNKDATPSHTSNIVQTKAISSCSSTQGNQSRQWILDTGATDHFTCNMTCYTTHHSIEPISIILPDGSTTYASISGTVYISQSLILLDVLYVPSFKVNLISVTKLASDLHCFLTFYSDHCFIHQISNQRKIGSAKQFGGLFMLDHSSNSLPQSHSMYSAASVQTNSTTLWHSRLGHIPDSKLKMMSNQFPFIPSSTIVPCDVCQFAK